MNFWKEHGKLRVILIALFFAAGMFLVVAGWRMTGSLAGLGWMVLGVVFLLTALFLYNRAFTSPGKKN